MSRQGWRVSPPTVSFFNREEPDMQPRIANNERGPRIANQLPAGKQSAAAGTENPCRHENPRRHMRRSTKVA